MRKILLSLMLLVLFALLFGELPQELQKSGNPKLYAGLSEKAGQNLKQLPRKLAQPYRELLKDHDDILMAYLLAYEADSKLAETDPKIVLENYSEIVKLLEQKGMDYSAEFFLSYIARQSVSDERISPYRKAMLEDGLDTVLEIADPLERYRATASWCVEKLLFMQTSGRDQSPLDITRKSLTGRCEEMQILFVAAARTVGLPSRPASTPWWAHMDNNHAWAEVFLDDEWHYTG
ncbi:MAG: transglutaminase-like domain-containing protein, partial [Candidatus Cloacimonadales bacterium]|nr:transglutaminase-like domain-containing protein [Candidatus Cloacimonadota bacterium]